MQGADCLVKKRPARGIDPCFATSGTSEMHANAEVVVADAGLAVLIVSLGHG